MVSFRVLQSASVYARQHVFQTPRFALSWFAALDTHPRQNPDRRLLRIRLSVGFASHARAVQAQDDANSKRFAFYVRDIVLVLWTGLLQPEIRRAVLRLRIWQLARGKRIPGGRKTSISQDARIKPAAATSE